MKIRIQDHRSVTLFTPLDTEAIKWIAETAPEDAQFFGRSMVVEPRYVENVSDAFVASGGEFS